MFFYRYIMNYNQSNILVTVTGPSLTGKTTFARLIEPFGYEEIVSTTTRPPREGEIHGKHYHFVSTDEFNSMLQKNLMIEKVQVGNNLYGISKPAFDNVIAKGKNAIAVVEPDGAQQVAKYCQENNINLHQIFLNNTQELILSRFLERFQTDNLAKIDTYTSRLLDIVNKEPKQWIEPAYNGSHYYSQVFDTFTKENQFDVLNEVLKSLDKKMNKIKKCKM